MAGLYDTLLTSKNLNIDLKDEEKQILSKWITSLNNKEIIKRIYILISEHAKRDFIKNYTEPYSVKNKIYKGTLSPMFALNELPIKLRRILWNFYIHRK